MYRPTGYSRRKKTCTHQRPVDRCPSTRTIYYNIRNNSKTYLILLCSVRNLRFHLDLSIRKQTLYTAHTHTHTHVRICFWLSLTLSLSPCLSYISCANIRSTHGGRRVVIAIIACFFFPPITMRVAVVLICFAPPTRRRRRLRNIIVFVIFFNHVSLPASIIIIPSVGAGGQEK